jgi:hypothetical protein
MYKHEEVYIPQCPNMVAYDYGLLRILEAAVNFVVHLSDTLLRHHLIGL